MVEDLFNAYINIDMNVVLLIPSRMQMYIASKYKFNKLALIFKISIAHVENILDEMVDVI